MDRPGNVLEWRVSERPVPYEAAVAEMESRVAAIRGGTAPELVWLLEHPSLYTAGTSAQETDLIEPARLPVYRTGRGGQYTYHGPGQRVAYVLLDLKRRGSDVRCFVRGLEEWIIATLARFNLAGVRRPGRIGVWIVEPGGAENKVAAIGIRIRQWVTYHGVALNVNPDLSHYRGIVACGIHDHGVTSLWSQGIPVSMSAVDGALRATFDGVFAGSQHNTSGVTLKAIVKQP